MTPILFWRGWARGCRSVFALLALALAAELRAADASGSGETDLTWFINAKFGIFIHWGVYSEGKGSESWAFRRGEMPYDDYMAQARTFTAEHYDPDAWARLFKEAGARRQPRGAEIGRAHV